MSSRELVPSTRVAEADWYGAALAGWARWSRSSHGGLAAYARILHPASGALR